MGSEDKFSVEFFLLMFGLFQTAPEMFDVLRTDFDTVLRQQRRLKKLKLRIVHARYSQEGAPREVEGGRFPGRRFSSDTARSRC